jgi:hypothetical protein
VRLRLSDVAPAGKGSVKKASGQFGKDFDAVMQARRSDADEFYATVIPASMSDDQARVVRQALAGMLWTKQFFHYDVNRWLEERGADPFNPKRRAPRNEHWHHMHNADIISMPDKWEYPWYAAWDLAFHVLALTLVDEDFGKQQLDLILREDYLHPNGQIPAYEWNFGDVNPPVHAWATIFTHRMLTKKQGASDVEWLERSFHKLLLNFTWWVNRKDPSGRNAFEGGFLGLDNIGVFDRSSPLPTGGHLEQADGTAWMALYCQNMLEIAAELATQKPAYAEMCDKFFAHYMWIASAMMHANEGAGMWDDEDGFFYDVLRLPNGESTRLKVRSMVGLLPSSRGSSWRNTPSWPAAFARSSRRARSSEPSFTIRLRRDVRTAGSRRSSTSRSFVACWPGCWTRTSFSARTAFAHCRASTPTTRSPSGSGDRNSGCPICRPSPTAACLAGTRTGAARSGCPSTASSCVRCFSTTRTTGTISKWSVPRARAAS